MSRRPDEAARAAGAPDTGHRSALKAGSARLRVVTGSGRPDLGAVLADLQRRAAAAGDLRALAFVLVNQTARAVPCRQAVLWRIRGNGRPALLAVSGLRQLAANTPNLLWLAELGRHLVDDGLAGDPIRELPPLPAELAVDQPAFLPGAAQVIRIDGGAAGPGALLLLAFDAPPSADLLAPLQSLLPVWRVAWQAATLSRRPAAAPGRRRRRRWLLLAAVLALLALLAVPVRLSVLAPAEVIALDSVVVAAPMDGVIREFRVLPNQAVRRGEPLFLLDDTTLRNRRAVALQQLRVASADVLAATQKAFTEPASRAELAALQGRVAEREAELAWLDEQLGRIEVTAPADGVALYTDPNDWIGRPVATGERVALVGDPASAGVLIWLSVNDALAIEPGAPVRLFLPTAPLEPRSARLIQTSYQSVLSPDGIAAYRLRAAFAGPDGEAGGVGDRPGPADPALRIGLRGTAKLYGERRPLLYYLMRRPLAALREWSGW